MDEKPALPDEVIDALQRGRKIEAIKRLRAAESLDLKAAKDRVDRYAAEHRELEPARRAGSINIVPLVLAATIAAAAYYVFR